MDLASYTGLFSEYYSLAKFKATVDLGLVFFSSVDDTDYSLGLQMVKGNVF